MSRLSSMTADAIRAVFSPDAAADLFILLTIQGPQSKAETQRFEFKLA